MSRDDQIRHAETFRRLHDGPEILILPNIWDPLGALLLESLGYPAVATASAAVSYARGHDDGEQLPFDDVVDAARRIVAAVEVPVSVDMERGYGDDPAAVAARVHSLLEAGAVGINIEDSFAEGGALRGIDEQCGRIAAVRAMAESTDIPLYINARVDTFMQPASASTDDRVTTCVERGQAYVDAGADGLYPIGLSNLDDIRIVVEQTRVPVNIYARSGVPSPGVLHAAGVRRLTLGPNLLRAAVEAMRRVALDLRDEAGTGYGGFGDDVISSDDIARLVRRRG